MRGVVACGGSGPLPRLGRDVELHVRDAPRLAEGSYGRLVGVQPEPWSAVQHLECDRELAPGEVEPDAAMRGDAANQIGSSPEGRR